MYTHCTTGAHTPVDAEHCGASVSKYMSLLEVQQKFVV